MLNFSPRKIALLAFILFWAISDFAQGQISTLHESELPIPQYLLDHLILNFKSYNDTTQLRLMHDSTNQSLLGTQEFSFGWRFDSGWSLAGTIVQTYSDNNNQSSQPGLQWQISDPSITVGHPLFYSEGGLRLGGQFSEYFPASPYFVSHRISEYAYYSFLNYTMSSGDSISHTLIPRYYFEPSYIAGDTTTYVEDHANWSRKIRPGLRAGFAEWTQIENHSQTPTGYCAEIYPFLNYELGPKALISPRLLFPVLASGSVYQGPTAVSMDNIRAEIFVQASL